MQSGTQRRLVLAPHLDDGAVSLGGSLIAAHRAKPGGPHTVVAWHTCRRIRLILYEDVPYVGQDSRDALSALGGLRAVSAPIAIEAKIELIQGYASQPIAVWEDLIRRSAGDPPVERTWIVEAPAVLDHLNRE